MSVVAKLGAPAKRRNGPEPDRVEPVTCEAFYGATPLKIFVGSLLTERIFLFEEARFGVLERLDRVLAAGDRFTISLTAPAEVVYDNEYDNEQSSALTFGPALAQLPHLSRSLHAPQRKILLEKRIVLDCPKHAFDLYAVRSEDVHTELRGGKAWDVEASVECASSYDGLRPALDALEYAVLWRWVRAGERATPAVDVRRASMPFDRFAKTVRTNIPDDLGLGAQTQAWLCALQEVSKSDEARLTGTR